MLIGQKEVLVCSLQVSACTISRIQYLFEHNFTTGRSIKWVTTLRPAQLYSGRKAGALSYKRLAKFRHILRGGGGRPIGGRPSLQPLSVCPKAVHGCMYDAHIRFRTLELVNATLTRTHIFSGLTQSPLTLASLPSQFACHMGDMSIM